MAGRDEDEEVTQVTILYKDLEKVVETVEDKAEDVVDQASEFERHVRKQKDSVQDMKRHMTTLPPPPLMVCAICGVELEKHDDAGHEFLYEPLLKP